MIAEVRLGRWQDVLSDAECDALITDPPYGERTHASTTDRRDGADTSGLAPEYSFWTPDDVREFVRHWSPRCRGWIVTMSCSDLAPVWRAEFEASGRQGFAPIPAVISGMSCRLQGDGPSSESVMVNVARPRNREFAKWGTLPGFYKGPASRSSKGGRGKPSWLCEALVRDYSETGGIVCDPCAGWGSQLVAARKMGRGAIGSEVDDEAWARANRAVRGAREQREMFPDAPRLGVGGS